LFIARHKLFGLQGEEHSDGSLTVDSVSISKKGAIRK